MKFKNFEKFVSLKKFIFTLFFVFFKLAIQVYFNINKTKFILFISFDISGEIFFSPEEAVNKACHGIGTAV